MTEAELTELRTWASAHAPVGCRQAQLVLVLLDRHAELSAIWNGAVASYPQPTPMPPALLKWWRGIYERITGRSQ